MKNSTGNSGFKSTMGGTRPAFTTSSKPNNKKITQADSERLLEDTKQMEKQLEMLKEMMKMEKDRKTGEVK